MQMTEQWPVRRTRAHEIASCLPMSDAGGSWQPPRYMSIQQHINKYILASFYQQCFLADVGPRKPSVRLLSGIGVLCIEEVHEMFSASPFLSGLLNGCRNVDTPLKLILLSTNLRSK